MKNELRSAIVLAVMMLALNAHAAIISVTNTNDSGAGSLRQAILDANLSTNVPDTITFSISGTGPFTITPATKYTNITDSVVIDGYTQPGASPNTSTNADNAVLKVKILGDTFYLTLAGSNITVRGLVIVGEINLPAHAPGGNVIEGCFLGVDFDGVTPLPETTPTMHIDCSNNRIGGTNVASRNIVAYHNPGIELFQDNNDPTYHTTNNVIQGNFIGVDAANNPAGNSTRGIQISMAPTNLVGGTTSGAANLIGFTDFSGVGINNAPGNKVLGNSIFHNGEVGIFTPDAIVTNPSVNLASNTLTSTIITGTLANLNTTIYRLEFFSSATSNNQGQTLIATTNLAGASPFTLTVPRVASSLFITATATGPETSKFSDAVPVITPGSAGPTNSWTNNGSGKWEGDFNWSLNVAPVIAHSAVFVTNANTKTITLDVTTADGFTSTMSISNLTVRASNTLALVNTGTFTPLHVYRSLILTNAGAITVTNGAVQVDGLSNGVLTVDGPFTITAGSLLGTSTTVRIGSASAGSLILSNTTADLGHPLLGVGAAGTISVVGGALAFRSVMDIGNNPGVTGTVWLSGSSLAVTGTVYNGLFGVGQITASNSTFTAANLTVASTIGTRGSFVAIGGTNRIAGSLFVGEASAATGAVRLVGSRLEVTNFPVTVGSSGSGQLTLSNATLLTPSIVLGRLSGSAGTLEVIGGNYTPPTIATTGSTFGAFSTLLVNGGQVTLTNTVTFIGTNTLSQIIVSNGILNVASLTSSAAGNAGVLRVAGGTANVTGPFDCQGPGIAAWITGGQFIVTNNNTFLSQLVLSNGDFLASDVFLGSAGVGTMTVAGGTFSMPGSFNGLAIGRTPATGTVWMTGGLINVSNTDITVGGLYFGTTGVGQMIVSNGTVKARQMYVGGNSSSVGTLTVAGGSLSVSNLILSYDTVSTGTVWVTGTAQIIATNTVINGNYTGGPSAAGQLIISNGIVRAGALNNPGGLLILRGGTLITDKLTFTNNSGYFVFSSGTLQTKSTADVHAEPIYIGNGINSATLNLVGGVHSFNSAAVNSLEIRSNSFLTGTGTITSTSVLNGGVIAPGNSVGRLDFNGSLVLTNSSELRFELGGYAPGTTHDLITVTNNTKLAGKLSVSFANDFASTVTNGATFIVLVGHTPITGAFGNVASGGLLATTDGFANFIVTYSGTNVVLSSLGILDSDVDGLPNWWEQKYFGTLTGADPNLDSDGDGFTNLQEFLAGTDPLDPLSFAATVTSWTDGTGKWEVSTNWSAGAPSSSFQAVLVTNAVTKTVTIDATTAGSFPGTMTISNLTVSCPPGTLNTLQISNVGLAAAFAILDSFTNGSGGNVVVTNSLLQVQGVSGGALVNNGTLTILAGGVVSNAVAALSVGSSANTTGSVWVTGGQLVVTNETTSIGDFGVGQMTVSSGTWRALNVVVGNFDGSQGRLTVAGGTNELSSFISVGDSAAATGAVWVTGGQLTVTNESTIVGSAGVGRMTVSNGTWRALNVILGNFDGSQGTLTVAGGTNELSSYLSIGDSAGTTGSVWVTGGQLTVTNNETRLGNAGIGQMTVSNGTWRAREVYVGANAGAQGTLTVAGGTATATNLILGVSNCTATGIVAVTGGSLFVTNAAATATLEVRSGTLTISSGTLRADRIVLTNACAHFTHTGGTLIYGTAVLNPADDSDGDGFTNQTEQNAGSDPLDPNSVPAGQLSVNPATLNFGTIATGTTAQASFVVTNIGAGILNGTATVGGPFTILSGSPFSLSANRSTNVVVRFAPVSAGSFTNTVVFNAGASGISSNSVTGTGAIVPTANFTATPTNGAAPLTVTFTNTSTGTITNDVWNFGDTVTSNTTATVLTHTYTNAGNFAVTLIAQGPVGVSTNSKPNLIRALNPPHLVVTPSSRDYGAVTVGLTNTLPFSVINTGDLTLTGTVATASPFKISVTTSYTVAPGQTGTVQVSFIPTGAGTFSNNVVFSSNGGVSTNSVFGTGVSAGQISVNPATLNFGTIATGTTSQRVFVVSNNGGVTVSNGTATVSAPFSVVAGQQFSVPPSGSTNVTVQFAPGSGGAFTNQVIFATANGGNSTNQVTGTGTVMPVANFTATPTNGVVPLTVTFTNTSTGTITNDVWNFGDSQTSNTTAAVLTHTYTNAGNFSVTLIAQGPVGVSTNSKANFIHALNPPHMMITPSSRDFGAVTVGVTNTLPFSVINTGELALTGTVATASPFAISGANSYTVQPGQTGTVQVSFIPTSASTFTNNVVFSSNGGASTNSAVGTGVLAGNIGVDPVALDFGTIATGTASQRVFVVSNAGGTTVTNGTVTVGAPFTVVSGQQFSVPASGSTNVVVQFAPVSAGAFTSQVVFATANGGNSTNQVTGAAAIAPAAGFTTTPTNGAAPLLVNFTDASTGTITNRLWNFGDTGTSTLASPSHTYSNAGVFSVSLTVFGPVGSSTTNAPNLITVTNVLPVAGFTANPTNGAAPLLVFFTDASTGTITNHFWTFGDGATSGGTAPTHTYTTAGVFSVSLTVSGPTGSDTLDRPDLITVTNVPPTAGFTASPTNGPAPLQVNFTDASTGTITNRLWDFGDGGTSTATSPSHTYTNAGSFSVTLSVFGPTGSNALTEPNLIAVTNAPLAADVEVIKLASPSPVSVASNLTYAITVTNRGPDTATSITLTDALPASVTFVSASDECTNTAGTVVCDLGSLNSGEATNITLVVVPTVEGSLTNIATVAASEADPSPSNNTATAVTQVFTVPPPPHDLAVVKLKAPKKINLSAKTTSKVGKFKVTIQNLGPQTETIPDVAALIQLVAVEVETLGTNCASFAATLVPPKKSFPLSLAPNKKLNLSYQATFDCANDPAATTKTEAHNDFQTVATVDLGALGEVDTTSSNDACPRPPSGNDPGCGNKTSSGTLGADVLTDVVVK